MNEPISGWYAAARAIHFAACMLLLGVWFFQRWIVGSPMSGRDGPVAVMSRRIGCWLVAIALPAALLSGIAWFWFVAVNMKDPDDPISFALFKLVGSKTQFGRVWQWRAAFWIGATVCFPLGSQSRRRPITRDFAGAAAAALLASIAWAGHGATGPAPAWHRAADVVHLLVCAAWPTGLIPLGLLLWRLRRSRQPIPAADADTIVRRFSGMATISVALLIASGAINAWCLVGSWSWLCTMRYGQVLLLKLAVFLAILILGARNLLVGKPRLQRVAARGIGDADSTICQIAWIAAVEAVLALGILAIVGLLGLLMPARM